MIEGFAWGGQLQNTTDVENYPGYPEGIMGPEMMQEFRAQAERFGTRFITDDATELELTDGGSRRSMSATDTYRARAVILSMGAEPKRLGIPGEQELQGRGVSTCGVCDGAFFKGEDVAVIGGGDSAMEDSIFISKFAKNLTSSTAATSSAPRRSCRSGPGSKDNIDFLTPYAPVEFVAGDDGKIEKVELSTPRPASRRSSRSAAPSSRSATPRARSWSKGQVDLDENGYVVTEEPSTKTNLAGVFAVGDLVDHTYRQAVTAAGSGTKGALDAEWYLRDTPPSPEAHWAGRAGAVQPAPHAAVEASS